MTRPPRYNAHMEIRTCHDLRRMCACSYCGGLGDKRHMIALGSGRAMVYQHGRCYIAESGLDAFLSLPMEVADTLYLSDIGAKAMKALLKRST